MLFNVLLHFHWHCVSFCLCLHKLDWTALTSIKFLISCLLCVVYVIFCHHFYVLYTETDVWQCSEDHPDTSPFPHCSFQHWLFEGIYHANVWNWQWDECIMLVILKSLCNKFPSISILLKKDEMLHRPSHPISVHGICFLGHHFAQWCYDLSGKLPFLVTVPKHSNPQQNGILTVITVCSAVILPEILSRWVSFYDVTASYYIQVMKYFFLGTLGGSVIMLLSKLLKSPE